MKKLIFLIMALFVTAGTVSASDKLERPTTPKGQGIFKFKNDEDRTNGRPICPTKPDKGKGHNGYWVRGNDQ